jgi:mono/diheme cytochrome c family protein
MRPCRSSLVLLLALAAGCNTPRSGGSAPPPPMDPREQLVEDLTLLATGETPTRAEIEETARRLASGRITIEKLVDRLLADGRFARNIAPQMLLDTLMPPADALSPGFVLKKTAGAEPVYYLRKPCGPEEVELVHPWWDEASTVRVCRDSHRPDQLVEPQTGFRCGGYNLHPYQSSFCGCGPNLMNCTESAEQRASFYDSMRDEVVETIAWIVDHDQPISRVFTQNETIRDARVEFLYQRWLVNSGRTAAVPDLKSWRKPAEPVPRVELVPGQHAGVLTTPQLVYQADAVRPRMRDTSSHLWCIVPKSSKASTETVLSLGATDLRDGEGWKKLAAMPICTNCHARLDYGMQFFAGYPNRYHSDTYLPPPPPTGPGRLYLEDIDDDRGEAPQTPIGFAELATRQPEFVTCVTKRLVSHVFGDAATPADRRELRDQLEREPSLRAVMRAALLRYAAAAEATAPPLLAASLAPASADPPASAELVAASPTLREVLDDRCIVCHTGGEYDLAGAKLPRALMERMLTQVGFRAMPRTFAGLGDAERKTIVTEVAAALFTDPARRQEAIAFFLAEGAAPEVRPSPQVDAILERRTGTTAALPNEMPYPAPAYWAPVPRLTPAFATTVAFQTLAGCKQAAAHREADLDRCLDAALAPAGLVRGPKR